MSDYKPSSIVVSLCKKLHAIPIAESIRLDGTVVIVVADGRKLTFFKDDITRTLTEPVGQGGVTVRAASTAALSERDGKPRTSRASIDLLRKSRASAASASRDAEGRKDTHAE